MTRPILSMFPEGADPFQEQPDDHLGLAFAYGPGRVRSTDGAVTDVAAGTVTLTDDTTNYIEVDGAGTVSDNATGFTPGAIPLYTVVTASGAITDIADRRTFLMPDGSAGFVGRSGAPATITVDGSAPSSPVLGDMWFDTSATGSGTYAPAASVATKAARNDRTAGDVVINSTSYMDVDNGLDLTFTGVAAGQWVELGTSLLWNNDAVSGDMDAATIVAGSPVNYVSGAAGASTGHRGIRAWAGSAGAYVDAGGSVIYQLQAGDLDGTSVTFRLRARCNSAGNKTIYANGSGSNPILIFWGKVLG